MTTAAELRKALDLIATQVMVIHTGLSGDELDAYVEAQARVDDAARTIALPILEADPELVERVAGVLSSIEVTPSQHHPSEMIDWARAVLAAISTPTPPQTFTASDCPENYWSPELGPCICRGKVHGPAISTPTPVEEL